MQPLAEVVTLLKYWGGTPAAATLALADPPAPLRKGPERCGVALPEQEHRNNSHHAACRRVRVLQRHELLHQHVVRLVQDVPTHAL
jgi:hypothetical protein